jgi:hypothetical protein
MTQEFDVPVYPVLEGFALQECGGYDTKRLHYGASHKAWGRDGNQLKVLANYREKNGRHQKVVVYPGCYVFISVSRDMLLQFTKGGIITRFERRKNGKWAAVCRYIYNDQFGINEYPDEPAIMNMVRNSAEYSMAPNAWEYREVYPCSIT